MEDLFLRGDLRDRGGDAGVHVADDEIDVVAFDELAGFLHAGAHVVGGVFDQQLELPAHDAALGVDLVDRELGAHDFVAGRRGINAGQRIDHSHFDVIGRAHRNDER